MGEKMVLGDNGQDKITIGDVAGALGISKTTVSRAISGKGRIGEATRQRVLEYIDKYGYQPSPIAKGLANQKTYNIVWIIPGDSDMAELPFFQKCMAGVIRMAEQKDYDVLISVVFENDVGNLRRIVNNKKADGAILGRTLLKDGNISFLKESGFPFVCIGSTDEPGVIQIDNDHLNACCELTSALIKQGAKNLALVGGMENHMVNRTRRMGFENAFTKESKTEVKASVYMNIDTDDDMSQVVEKIIAEKNDCIVCTDDKICAQLLEKLRLKEIRVPEDIMVASFYYSELISQNETRISSIRYEPEELGEAAAKVLFDYLEGEEVSGKTLLGYELCCCSQII